MTLPESSAEEFTDSLLASKGKDPCLLVQHLHAIQYAFSFIPEASVRRLAAATNVPESRVRGLIGFYSFLHDTPRGDYDILFSDNITDRMLGNRELMRDLCAQLGVEPGAPRRDGRVSVDRTSCTGLCDQGPALLVNGIAVTKLDSHRIGKIAALVEDAEPLDEWPSELFEKHDNIRLSDIMLSMQPAMGEALRALIEKGADAMLENMEASGLRGRGGAGFSAARKWKICRGADNVHDRLDRVVICNADEGEPGTFKDRVLLDTHIDDILEGMTLCAGVVGARQGFIYLRGEYLYMRDDLERALQRRRDAGLLGRGILGEDGFDFDIEIHMGAGAYICGEESALIESLEGKRGIPRNRPPYPVTCGYLGKPTVMNNVETFLASTGIARYGPEWHRAKGTEESAGTKLLSISGDCERPGIYEFPYGVSIREILAECDAHDTQAVQVAGAAGFTVPPEEFGRTIAFEDFPTAGSLMVFDHSRDLLDVVQNFADFFVHESCGFCTPCRVGNSLIQSLVEKVRDGRAGQYDTGELWHIGTLMQTASHCGLGKTAPGPVLDTLSKFPEVYEKRLAQTSYEPAFDLDASLQRAREITGRDDAGAHIRTKS